MGVSQNKKKAKEFKSREKELHGETHLDNNKDLEEYSTPHRKKKKKMGWANPENPPKESFLEEIIEHIKGKAKHKLPSSK